MVKKSALKVCEKLWPQHRLNRNRFDQSCRSIHTAASTDSQMERCDRSIPYVCELICAMDLDIATFRLLVQLCLALITITCLKPVFIDGCYISECLESTSRHDVWIVSLATEYLETDSSSLEYKIRL